MDSFNKGIQLASLSNAIRSRIKELIKELDPLMTVQEYEKVKTEIEALIAQHPRNMKFAYEFAEK